MYGTLTRVFALCASALVPVLAGAQEPAPDAADFDDYGKGKIYHVATTGSDQNPGTAARPFRTVQRGVAAVKPGETVLVHKGTYYGVVEIRTSGREDSRIYLAGAGDGPAILKANFPITACSATSPTRDRTIQILDGADHWTIQNLTIVNGILVAGKNSGTLKPYIGNRSLPGRGSYDPDRAPALLPSLDVNPSDYIRIAENKITGRGMLIIASRWGRVLSNEISDIECGTGSGITLSRFSDFWGIRNNFVHHNELSAEHPMEEGIRLVSGSNYNFVEENLVQDLVGRGRGFAVDVGASWNTIVRNTAKRAAIGFNEQDGGWGNVWAANRAESVRETGFKVASKDSHLTWPDDGVPAYVVFRYNCSVGNPTDLGIGALQASTFESNSFSTFNLSSNVLGYWKKVGNTYDGSPEPPAEPGRTMPGCK